jgi:3-phenylpropionate/trans-cinnamate dioxygenase ferredoxin subunit
MPTQACVLRKESAVTQWIAAHRVVDIDVEGIVPVGRGGHQDALGRSETDGFFAAAGYRTREPERLCDGLRLGKTIECPQHNGRFEYASGRARGAPAMEDRTTYLVTVGNHLVLVGLG